MKRNLLCLFVCTAMAWCADPARAEVIVVQAWVRMPPPVADTSAAYMILRNEDDRDIAVDRVSSDVSTTSEIHTVLKQGAMMRMSVVNVMSVPAHGVVKLEPGGLHIMLTGLKRKLKQGEGVNLVLHFTDGSALKVVAPVRDPRHPMQEPARRIYEQGMELAKKKQLADAVSLFQQASEQGNRRAQYQMGLLYARGDGVKKDFGIARKWLRKAAMQGHPKAQFYLGQMYAFGDGGEQDNVKASMWFWLATTLGDRYAKDSLRVMTGKIAPHELIEAKKLARALWREMPHDMKIKRGMAMH